MMAATRFSFCGETRRLRAMACASVSGSLRWWLGLPMLPLHRFLIAAVARERAGRRELAELVPDHVLVDRDGDMLLSIVDAEGQPDELRQDGRATRPDLDNFV